MEFHPRSSAIETTLRLAAESKGLIELEFASSRVESLGQVCFKQDAQEAPTVYANVGAGTYLAVALDIDAPFPSWDRFGPVLQWIQPHLSPDIDVHGDKGSAARLRSLSSDIAPCVQYLPSNPVWPSTAHRVLYILYRQPASFSAPAFRSTSVADWLTGPVPRIWFDLADFERRAKLDRPIAATYFLVAP